MQIGVEDLIAFKIGINQAAKYYNLPFVSATLRLIGDIKTYNKIDGPKKELQKLSLQKFAITEACDRQAQALIALGKMQNQRL